MKYLNFANPLSGNGKPESLMTLIDLSPSMDEEDWKPSRREGAIKANIELIELKAKYHPQDTVGVIGFGSHAKLLHRSVKIGDNSKSVRDSLKKTPSQLDHQYEELADLLSQMGLNVTCNKVRKAVKALYPAGLAQCPDEGMVIRDLFRYFR